jgi:hypothetical protein
MAGLERVVRQQAATSGHSKNVSQIDARAVFTDGEGGGGNQTHLSNLKLERMGKKYSW